MPSRIQANPAIQQQLAQRGITEKTGIFGQHMVQIGAGSPIRIDHIKGNSVPYQGFRTATRVARGNEGLAASSRNTLSVLSSSGTLKADKLLAALKTNTDYMNRLNKLGQLTAAQQNNALWAFAPAVESLSNAELAAVYQSFTSAEMDLLQTALKYEGQRNPKAGDARSAGAQLFDLQALILKEMSNRVSNGILDDLIAKEPAKADEYNALRPALLSLQYANAPVPRTGFTNDITAANLHTLANVAAESATRRERSAATETQKLHTRGISATPKDMGDVLRQSPLTINIPARRLLRDTSFILSPDDPMPTVFHMQQQGILSKGESYMHQRDATEKLVFPELEGHEVIADERPVYGALNTTHSQVGPAARSYGSCVIVLKPEVARRSTFIAEDTFYSPAIKITPERKETFYTLLDGSGLPADTIAKLKDPQSQEHAALEKWFNRGEQITELNANFLKLPPRELELPNESAKELFAALSLQAFGDKAATRAKIASYDNLESLLPGLHDLNGSMLAQAAEKYASGEDPSVRLAMNYIEAQIHGPLIPSRDFQEIRVNLEEAEPEERAQLISRMEDFSKNTGVKVVYITDRINPQETEGVSGTFERTANDDDRVSNLYQAGLHYYAQHIRSDTEKALGDAFEHIQDHLRRIVEEKELASLFPANSEILRGTILEKVKGNISWQVEQFFNKPNERGNTPEKIVAQAIRDVASPFIEQKASLLRVLDETPLTSAQKAGFSYWVRSSLVKTPEELQLAIKNAQIQSAALYTIATAPQPLSAADTFRILAEAGRATDRSMAEYAAALPKNKEYGTDDKNADMDRATFLPYILLKNSEQPLNDSQIRALYEHLNSPDMRNMWAQLNQVVDQDAACSARDYGELNTISRLFLMHIKNSARQIQERFSKPAFTAELSLLPESNRALFREAAPEAMARFDAAYPAYATFPAAAKPENMPATDAARRDFLVRHLDAYIAHERSFDRRAFTHGRGHVARAFIYASAMCSILEKYGLAVDRNAVLCVITGHDMGRQGSGTDIWEKDSAALTVSHMRHDFGADTMGEAYEQAIIDSTTKNSPSVEGMVFKAADSLDIGRTRTLDLTRMPFLRCKDGEEISYESKAIREQLAKEADLLQRLTNPLCAHRTELLELDNQLFASQRSPLELEQLSAKKAELLGKIQQELEGEWQLDAEHFMARIEKTIHDNQQLFPVLSEYYH